jgi:hypothetical protein
MPDAVADLADLWRIELRYLDRSYVRAEVIRRLALPEFARFLVKPIETPKPKPRPVRPPEEW